LLRTVDDFLSVVGPERAAVVTKLMRKLLHVRAIGIHSVDVQIAVARRGEDDVLAVARNSGFGVVSMRFGNWLQIAAIRLGGVHGVSIVDGPNVAVRIIRWRRAGIGSSEGGGVKHARVAGKEIAAGGPTACIAEHL